MNTNQIEKMNNKKEKLKLIFGEFLEFLIENRKLIILGFLISFIFYLYHIAIANKIAKYLSIDEVSNQFLLVITIFLSFILFITFFWLGIRNYRLSKNTVFWILLINTFYLIVRQENEDNLVLIPFIKNIYLFDIIFLMSFFMILLILRNRFISNSKFDSILKRYNSFKPIKNDDYSTNYLGDIALSGKDKIHNENSVIELCNFINESNPQKAYNLAICAQWGLGKTSYLKRLEYLLINSKTQNPIIIWFNAWNHQDETTILNTFFTELKTELSKYDGNAVDTINQYIISLLSILGTNESKILKFLIGIGIKEELNIQSHINKIEKIISKTGRKLVVLVDDMDRLNGNEIKEVLRILRNVANFKSTFFVCGVDKGYLIKESKIDDLYLDKIFNFEIQLPKINDANLEKAVFDSIDEFNNLDHDFKQKIHEVFNEIFGFKGNSFYHKEGPKSMGGIPIKANDIFDSYRDVKRFLNYLIFNLKSLQDISVIDLKDYILFRILLFKFPWILESFNDKNLPLWMVNEDFLNFDLQKLKSLNVENESLISKSKLLEGILNRLFPKNINDIIKEIAENKIRKGRNLPLYINNNIFNEILIYSSVLQYFKNRKLTQLLEENKIEPMYSSNLKDVADFIINPLNIENQDDFDYVIDLIRNYERRFDNDKLLLFFDKIENKFSELEYKAVFTNLDDNLCEFLMKLNKFYACYPSPNESNFDSTYENDEFFNYFKIYGDGKFQLEKLNKDSVKDLILKNLETAISEKRNYKEIENSFLGSFNMYFHNFKIGTFDITFIELFKKYIKEIWITEMMNSNENFQWSLYDSMFLDTDDKEAIIQNVDNSIKLTRIENISNLITKLGRQKFIDFLKMLPDELELSDSDRFKYDKNLKHLF